MAHISSIISIINLFRINQDHHEPSNVQTPPEISSQKKYVEFCTKMILSHLTVSVEFKDLVEHSFSFYPRHMG